MRVSRNAWRTEAQLSNADMVRRKDTSRRKDQSRTIVDGRDRFDIEERLLQRPRQQQADVADHQLAQPTLWAVGGPAVEITGEFEPGLTLGSGRIIC